MKLLNPSTRPYYDERAGFRGSKYILCEILDWMVYSYSLSLTYGYLIGPMKMRSLRKSIIDPKNVAGPMIFQMGLEFSILSIRGL